MARDFASEAQPALARQARQFVILREAARFLSVMCATSTDETVRNGFEDLRKAAADLGMARTTGSRAEMALADLDLLPALTRIQQPELPTLPPQEPKESGGILYDDANWTRVATVVKRFNPNFCDVSVGGVVSHMLTMARRSFANGNFEYSYMAASGFVLSAYRRPARPGVVFVFASVSDILFDAPPVEGGR